jgi:hypothetical protein
MKKYPSIEQFRSVVKNVRYEHDYKGSYIGEYPTLKFEGTVKLHGTNAGIVKYLDGRIEHQSRERVLSIEKDNAGFMLSMLSIQSNVEKLFSEFVFNESCVLYGEWCGGSIQRGVALNQLEKMFVIFGVKVDDLWVELPLSVQDNDVRIYNINQFKKYYIEIDFNHPELIQNKLIELTMEVEENCPVGDYFGIDGIGEGIVFTSVDNQDYKFKSKGEKHSSSKVKVLNSVTIEEIEGLKNFVNYSVSENRLNQGINSLIENNIEIESKNIGQFIKWIVKDVLKEEIDTIVLNKLNVKAVSSAIAKKSRNWFLNKI